MSNTADEPSPEQDTVDPTQGLADDIDWSQFHDMFLNIERRLPNFDHMLMAMNDYAFQRTSSRRQTNNLIAFCEVIKKGLFDWYTRSINNEIKVPNFMDLTNQVFNDDILMKIDKKLVSSTSSNTNANKGTYACAITDANESTNTCANTDPSKSTTTSSNTDADKGTYACAITDANESTNICANTDPSKSTSTSSNTDANKGTYACAITDDNESTNTSANADASESTNTSANTCTHKSINTSANTCTHKSVNKGASACSHTSASSSTYKRARTSHLNSNSAMVPNTKHFYKHLESKRALEAKSQSTKTNVTNDTNHNFQIIMPYMPEQRTYLRKRLPINHNIHLGSDCGRHWWRQTHDKITLHVDISDLVIGKVPNIKVVVTIIGFKIKIKCSDKWIVLISNKFEKAISKCKWIINKFRHVKITIDKRENEFWSKCLVTETREIDTSNFKNHSCSKKCSLPYRDPNDLEGTPQTKKECMANLTKYLRKEYCMESSDEFEEAKDQSTVTNPSGTAEKSKDSAVTLKSSVDPSTVKSLNSDSEDPPNTESPSMDSEVPPNLSESSNLEVS